jgi:hypothetical protein
MFKWSVVGFAAVASALPQGVPVGIAPSSPAPEGCSENYDGSFLLSVRAPGTPSNGAQGDCTQEGSLVVKLADGVLTDAQGRIGSIVSNYQFQFDGPPPQAGAIYTGGFSVCSNGSLALGGHADFYQCLSGDFYNLYDRHWAEQCSGVELLVIPCAAGGSTGGGSNNGGSGGSVTTTVISQLPDGQPAAIPTYISQIGDGQIQAPQPPVISQITDGQIQVPTETPAPPPVISQITDGQVQAPTETPAPPPPVISQITDGQIQAPTETPAPPPPPPVISQITDGQIQAPTETPEAPAPPASLPSPIAPPVISQITDGQIQAPTETPEVPPVSLPTPVAPPVISQITDGQIQAPTETPVVPPPVDEAPPANTTTPITPPIGESGASSVVAGASTLLMAVLCAAVFL